MEMDKLVKTSYDKKDVVVLLKDLTDEMKEMSTEEREKAIQSGTHYSEMLPKEYEPSCEYEDLFNKALRDKKDIISKDIAHVSEMLWHYSIKTANKVPIIVSLARAGIPVGILIKRYLKKTYNVNCPHYAISIIRDRGIDINAMNFIYNKEVLTNENLVQNIFFVDGWTGKGAIKTQLEEAVAELKKSNNKWNGLSDNLWVLADPANITEYCGTHEDYLLPSACLNSTVSGLTSRTILNSHIDVENGDFHGAVYFSKFERMDYSNKFIDTIAAEFENTGITSILPDKLDTSWNGMTIVNSICNDMGVADYKKVKPGVGETTRVLLRRVPWKVLINNSVEDTDEDIQHILVLCKEKNIPVERYSLGHYKVCGIIKELSADA
jgi:hypothetical protein